MGFCIVINIDQEIWRWNSDSTWHYFCSTCYGANSAKTANNNFIKYHHLRSCIYFAVCTIESFLNQEMRRILEAQSVSEEKIYQTIRKPSIKQKMRKWPQIIYNKPIEFEERVLRVIDEYRELRNEITHPKRRDHAIYYVLDQSNPDQLVDAIGSALACLYDAKEKPFPYWILGWNYVGMNGNPAFPTQLNNLNGFYYSLKGMGFSGLGADITFEDRCMSTKRDFDHLLSQLKSYPEDIEPYWEGFPSRPRLTRRWWDHEFIISNVKTCQEEEKSK